MYLKELNIKKQSRVACQCTTEPVKRITGTTGSGTRCISQTLGSPTNNLTKSDYREVEAPQGLVKSSSRWGFGV